ncbi:hypothetical protein W97_05778 [Coniosporium apollinis CBS 100218]|uniref:Extracellular membrane protein CFEM domain-containing protein n=1 Tax=Coniosporium apollinis (strain CBS 100218) TaxID=1168221 RepID=R7YXF5_CONA1|nr:uncharacterized protein W97_05778 [Coniosporium apollinis CBS 100218]EON66533.1 hypothetical protein W97_05778 [Coniosporium apollinis CBS 100218]
MYIPDAAILVLTALTVRIAAQDVDYNDLPSQCQSVCAPVVELTQRCDQQHSSDDAGQLNCVCAANNATAVIPVCEACYAMFDPDGHDNGKLAFV